MRKNVLSIFSFLAFILFVTPANSANTGSYFLKVCNDNANYAEKNFCYGYIDGAIETYEHFRALYNSVKQVCIFEETSADEIRKTYITYLKDHPDMHGHEAYLTIIKSLEGAYPCE